MNRKDRTGVNDLKFMQEQITEQIKIGKFLYARQLVLEIKNVLYELQNEQAVNGIVGIDIKKADLEYYQAWVSDVAIDRLTLIQSELQLSQFEADLINYV
ncbi:MAG: hypothetical protein IPL55_15435 [Saprospiraceae bacterium]|nr:hypothetical protein [Saprospiraceae bacterium]